MRRLFLPVRVFFHAVRRRGLRDTWRRAMRSFKTRDAARQRRQADRAFDSERRVETAGWVRTSDLVTESPNRRFSVRYQPSSVDEFDFLMSKLDVDHREFVFVDYGSGKGRVLMLAAAYPFKRIVGIEFSPPLAEIAGENVATLGPDAARVETRVVDAVEFDPPSEPLVVYFFNPFELPVLRPVLARLRESLESDPRPVYVVATGPPELGRAIDEAGFAPVDVEAVGWRTRGVFARVPSRQRAGIAVGTWATALAGGLAF